MTSLGHLISTFEKRQRKYKTRDIVVQEEESDHNYMSGDSLASSNDSESQISRKVVKDDFGSEKNTAENPFGGNFFIF